MKSTVLIRTGSIGLSSASPRVSYSRHNALVSAEKQQSTAVSPRVALHFDVNNNRRGYNSIRRALSGKGKYLRSPGSGILEVEDIAMMVNTVTTTIEREEKRKMGEYYQEMLKSNPSEYLLLRNYGQFLHEVEKDMVRAEKYYCRAILASPGDGELLSLYGKLIWESQRDKDRAKSYFDQAISASPDNCMVLGSFASFMWEAEEDEEDDEEFNSNSASAQVSSAAELVPAF